MNRRTAVSAVKIILVIAACSLCYGVAWMIQEMKYNPRICMAHMRLRQNSQHVFEHLLPHFVTSLNKGEMEEFLSETEAVMINSIVVAGPTATQVEQERDKWRDKWDARMGSTFTVGCVNCGAFHYNKDRATDEEFATAWKKLTADWPQDAFFYEDVGKGQPPTNCQLPKFDIRAAAKRSPSSVDVVELPRTIESSVGEQRTRRYRALRLTYDLGGKKLAVYGMHLVANDHVREPKTAKGAPSLSQKLRRRQFEALIEDARKFDFAILTGDFNAQAAWEYDVFVKAGFSIGNCSPAYGTKATLRNIPADNIILSPGLAFVDFHVLDGYVLNTDHLPLVATVRLDR